MGDPGGILLSEKNVLLIFWRNEAKGPVIFYYQYYERSFFGRAVVPNIKNILVFNLGDIHVTIKISGWYKGSQMQAYEYG